MFTKFRVHQFFTILFFELLQKKKKTKTVVEKYWDWELTNETQPIWVNLRVSLISVFDIPCKNEENLASCC